jgi:hypothetical protein
MPERTAFERVDSYTSETEQDASGARKRTAFERIEHGAGASLLVGGFDNSSVQCRWREGCI